MERPMIANNLQLVLNDRRHVEHSGQLVEVAVEYQLAEYKRVVRDFIPMHYEATGRRPNRLLPWNWPVVEGAMFAVFVPIVFWIKKRSIGNCVFTFSEAGVSRISRGQAADRDWSEIQAVHRLSAAYLIELKGGGAMPVPYRVYTLEQRQLFESLCVHLVR